MHPVTETKLGKLTGAASVLTAAALVALLVERYGDFQKTIYSLIISAVYIAILSCSAYYYWSVRVYLKAPGAKAVVALLVQLAAIAGAAITLALVNPDLQAGLYKVLPLVLTTGFLLWLSVELWYSLKSCIEDEEPVKTEDKRPQVNISENISVKEGNRLHIIKADQLHYIQAYGDYVMLHTQDGKFVKEETMKYFEASLPDYFVRIHRSVIVNSGMIVRTELYGKESYTIHLSSGVKLRASAGGYKLLKEKLSLN